VKPVGQDDPGRAEDRVPPIAEPSTGRSPVFMILGLLAVAIAVAVAIWATRSHERGETTNATATGPVSREEEVEKSRSEPESEAQLAAAFQAAFGKAGEATLTTGDDSRTYRPSRLLRTGDTYVLLSAGENQNDCHACSGTLAIHYLRAQGDGFAVVGSWPDLVPGLGYGEPPDWTVSNDYGRYPSVHAEIGYTAQGCTSGAVSLTELRPDKPVQTELIPIHYENQSGIGDLNGKTIDGTIGNIRKDTSFDVTYSGARSFVEKWVKDGDGYRLESGETQMPQC
jgi:hypothetical protein